MITKKPKHTKITIDLTGPEGNAFVLLGKAGSFAKQLGWNKDQIKDLHKRMTSGDYENLVSEFDKAFGTIVTLYR